MTTPLTEREKALLHEVENLKASNRHKQNVINQQNQDAQDSWSTGDVMIAGGVALLTGGLLF